MKKQITFIAFVLLAFFSSKAQDNLISDAYNVGSTINDQGLTTRVLTYPFTGVGYLSTNGGIYQHWGPTNNGAGIGTLDVMGIWDATTGQDDFDGPGGTAGIQQITGNTAPVFGILNFNNGVASQLNILNTQGIDVAVMANYLNGITTTIRNNTFAGAMRFSAGAAYTGSVNNLLTASGADAQHVDGYVGKKGNTSFVFPVGSGTDARPLQISAPASITDEYDVAWIAGNPTVTPDPSDGGAMHSTGSFAAPILNIHPAGQWDWIPVSGSGAGLTISVSIPDMSAFASPAGLRLVGWNGTQWIDLSGAPMASGNTENSTLSGTMVAGITAIGIGSVEFILPVTLTEFNAVKQEKSSLLSWKTFSEFNSAYFEVERATDAVHFEVIGDKIGAAGNSKIELNYNMMDKTPAVGTNYYRLKMVDMDGRYTFSEVRKVNFSFPGNTFNVIPNPSNGFTAIGFALPLKTDAHLRIYNSCGQLVMSEKIIAGTQTYNLDISKEAKGTYLMRIETDEMSEQVKILVK